MSFLKNVDLINLMKAPKYDSEWILDLISPKFYTKNFHRKLIKSLGDIEVESACTPSDHRLFTSNSNLSNVPK